MRKLTAADLVDTISQLDDTRIYDYVSGRSRLRITNIQQPEGPISFVNINEDGSLGRTGNVTIGQLAQMALVCSNKPNFPLHIDRVFSAGGNSRSAFEALLAYTPHFFICYPDRVDAYSGEILRNLKHIMWCPDETHKSGEITLKTYNQVITEFELGVDFGQISVPLTPETNEFDIEAERLHTQMQIALIEIGNALNFHTWIAKNDRAIRVRDTTLGELEGVISSLDEVPIFFNKQIRDAASFIDCIWFTDDHNEIPAIIEIEHSTGVISGLHRMQRLHNASRGLKKTFTIVAPNHLRNKVVVEANQYPDLQIRFMPYSTVRELYGLIQRYHLKGVVDETFIYPFMEPVVSK